MSTSHFRFDPSSSVALVGAGISVDAGLPTAEELYDMIVNCLVHREWAAEELKRLFRPQRKDAIDRFDSIRLETLLLWVSDVYDSNLEFFKFLDDYNTPDS